MPGFKTSSKLNAAASNCEHENLKRICEDFVHNAGDDGRSPAEVFASGFELCEIADDEPVWMVSTEEWTYFMLGSEEDYLLSSINSVSGEDSDEDSDDDGLSEVDQDDLEA